MAILASSPSTGAKPRTTPQLCAPPSMRYYRRSTTTKAPRKRTFLLTMTKYDSDLATPPGVAAAVFANNVAMLSYGPCQDDEAALFSGEGDGFGGCNNNNNNNNNNNGGGNGGGNGSSGDGWRFGSEGPHWGSFPPVLGQACLGALAIISAVAVFPGQSAATQGTSPSPSPSTSPNSINSLLGGSGSPMDPTQHLLSSSAPSCRGGFGPLADVPMFRRTSTSSNPASSGSSSSGSRPLPRSKVMHVACKGSTLVVPLTGGSDAKAAVPQGLKGPWQRAKIVDAPIVLSGNEISVLDLPQYRVRESMLV